VIIRILGEGQWEVDAAKLADLNELDRHVEHAIKVSDNIEFREALTRLLTEVHEEGTPVPDDVFIESDLVLPPSDATLEDVKAMLSDEGLLPG
jgi:hypothetical protein